MPATTTDNLLNTDAHSGRNVRPELSATSAFYTETDQNGRPNFEQGESGRFGAVDSRYFRTTSKITYTGKVFAVCTGQVFLQPNEEDNSKVNLILRPFRQPINGLPIKYFVYRGLNKSDFLSSDGTQIAPAGVAATGFVNRIQEEFEKFNTRNAVTPPFLSKYIGYPDPEAQGDEVQQDTDHIDQYFFKLSDVTGRDAGPDEETNAFEFPIIPQGTYLGNAAGSLGVDIVLNEGDYTIENDPNPFKLDLTFARSADHVLDTGLGDTGFRKKLIRESATLFLDAAAFYGLHTQGKGKIYLNGQTDSPVTDSEDVYRLIEKYKTANTVYIYIQSNRQRSYNFYGNYDLNGKNIKIGTDPENLQEKLFGNNGWPLEIINNSNETFLLSLLNDRKYRGKIFYIDIGIPTSNNEYNQFAKEKSYINSDSTLEIDYTYPIEFKVANIATITKIIYLSKDINYSTNTYNTNYSHYDYLKELFPIINPKNYFDISELGKNDISKTAYNLDNVINLSDFSDLQNQSIVQNQLILYYGKKLEGDDIHTKSKALFLSKKKETLDSSELNNSTDAFGSISSLYINNIDNEHYRQNILFGGNDFSIYYKEIVEDNIIIKILNLKKKEKDDHTFFSLGITQDELQQVISIIPSNAANVRFYLKSEFPNPRTDTNNLVYYKYSLGISYENDDGVDISFPSNEVFVYGDRITFFSSKDYADYEENVLLDIETF